MRNIQLISIFLAAFFGTTVHAVGNQKVLSINQQKTLNEHLLKSVSEGSLENVKKDIKNGANVNYFGPQSKLTPLMLAVELNRVDIVKFLIDSGSDVNAKMDLSQSSESLTPLLLACQNVPVEKKGIKDKTMIMKALINAGAKINIEQDNFSPLQYAASIGNLSLVKYMLKHGAEVNFKVGGKTPVTYAAENGHSKVAKYLQSKGGVGDLKFIPYEGE